MNDDRSPDEPPDVTAPGPPSVYRLDYRPGLRVFGVRFVLAAVLVVVAWLCAGAFDGGAGRVVAWVAGIVAALVVVVSIVLLLRPPIVVHLDADGYRLGRVPQGGARRGRWVDVTGAVAQQTHQGYALVLQLDDKSSTIPLLFVASRANELQREVNQRLNRAHGYRRLE